MSMNTDRPTETTEVRSTEDPGSQTAAYLPYLGELTYDEIHAAYLGTMGLLVGYAYTGGMVEEAIAFSLTVGGVALGIRAMPADLSVPGSKKFRKPGGHPFGHIVGFLPWVLETAAARTIRREPWYFITIYVVSFLAGVGVVEILARTA